MLELCGMFDSNFVNTLMWAHFKLKFILHDLFDVKYEFIKNVSYSNVIGSIIYAMIGFSSNIIYAINLVSRFMGKPKKEHWNATKWLLRYLKGSYWAYILCW